MNSNEHAAEKTWKFQPGLTALVMGLFFWALSSTSRAEQVLSITPPSFDFGWCPDNSKISAEFTLRNAGVDIIPITNIQPTCGCTASQFTPGSLSSNEETKVVLTFNTRGYINMPFNKATKVKTDSQTADYNVTLSGYVLNPTAKIYPDSEGVAGFGPDSPSDKKKLHILNKSDKDVTLEIVQEPAKWASYKLESKELKQGSQVAITIKVDGDMQAARDTSITFSADDGQEKHRFTIAIRTGPPPMQPRKPLATPAKSPVSPKPAK